MNKSLSPQPKQQPALIPVKQTLENYNTLRNYSGLSNINHPLLPVTHRFRNVL